MSGLPQPARLTLGRAAILGIRLAFLGTQQRKAPDPGTEVLNLKAQTVYYREATSAASRLRCRKGCGFVAHGAPAKLMMPK
jgi:hypothetical protein